MNPSKDRNEGFLLEVMTGDRSPSVLHALRSDCNILCPPDLLEQWYYCVPVRWGVGTRVKWVEPRARMHRAELHRVHRTCFVYLSIRIVGSSCCTTLWWGFHLLGVVDRSIDSCEIPCSPYDIICLQPPILSSQIAADGD